jgi:polar amino acid transport system substrate-binding protein
MSPQSAAVRLLAPQGHVRVAINFGNAALAQRDAATGAASGVAVDIMRALADALGAPCRLVAYDAAGKVVAGLEGGEWDVAFLATDPIRSEVLSFTPAYVQIPACYMVHAAGPLRASADVDAPGRTVAVGRGAAYDLHLTRTLKHATLERRATAAEAFMLFETAPLDAAAGVRRVVQHYAADRPHLRVLADNFLAVDQALCVPRARVEGLQAGLAWLGTFVERLKQTGFIAQALQRNGQADALVAPPG